MLKLKCFVCGKPSLDLTHGQMEGHVNGRPVCASCLVGAMLAKGGK
jgi:hypothetical protein